MSERLLRVSLTFQREDGSLYTKTATGEHANKWKEFSDNVCALASVHGWNPAWETITWTIVEPPARELLMELDGEEE